MVSENTGVPGNLSRPPEAGTPSRRRRRRSPRGDCLPALAVSCVGAYASSDCLFYCVQKLVLLAYRPPFLLRPKTTFDGLAKFLRPRIEGSSVATLETRLADRSGNSAATTCSSSQQILAAGVAISRQKAAGAREEAALSAIQRYVGGGACYHEFPRMSLLGSPVNRASHSLRCSKVPDIFMVLRNGAMSSSFILVPILFYGRGFVGRAQERDCHDPDRVDAAPPRDLGARAGRLPRRRSRKGRGRKGRERDHLCRAGRE